MSKVISAKEALEISNKEPTLEYIMDRITEAAKKGYTTAVIDGYSMSTRQINALEGLGYSVKHSSPGRYFIKW